MTICEPPLYRQLPSSDIRPAGIGYNNGKMIHCNTPLTKVGFAA